MSKLVSLYIRFPHGNDTLNSNKRETVANAETQVPDEEFANLTESSGFRDITRTFFYEADVASKSLRVFHITPVLHHHILTTSNQLVPPPTLNKVFLGSQINL